MKIKLFLLLSALTLSACSSVKDSIETFLSGDENIRCYQGGKLISVDEADRIGKGYGVDMPARCYHKKTGRTAFINSNGAVFYSK